MRLEIIKNHFYDWIIEFWVRFCCVHLCCWLVCQYRNGNEGQEWSNDTSFSGSRVVAAHRVQFGNSWSANFDNQCVLEVIFLLWPTGFQSGLLCFSCCCPDFRWHEFFILSIIILIVIIQKTSSSSHSCWFNLLAWGFIICYPVGSGGSGGATGSWHPSSQAKGSQGTLGVSVG